MSLQIVPLEALVVFLDSHTTKRVVREPGSGLFVLFDEFLVCDQPELDGLKHVLANIVFQSDKLLVPIFRGVDEHHSPASILEVLVVVNLDCFAAYETRGAEAGMIQVQELVDVLLCFQGYHWIEHYSHVMKQVAYFSALEHVDIQVLEEVDSRAFDLVDL